MTALGKTLFSLLLVGAGFGLASVFGPPDLADRLAEQLTPGKPADPWGELRPAPLDRGGESWSYFAQSQVDRLGLPSGALTAVNEAPAFEPTPASEPNWMSPRRMSPVVPADFDAPPSLEIASNNNSPVRQDRSVAPAAAQDGWFVGDRYASQQPAAPAPWPGPFTSDPAPVAVAPNPQPAASPWSQPPFEDPAYRSASYRRPAPPEGAWQQAVQNQSLPEQSPWQPAAAPSWSNSPSPNSFSQDSFGQAPGMQPVAPESSEEPAPRTHIVADGDTLAGIAQRYLGDATRAVEVYEWNRELIDHPDLLPIGAELQLKGAARAPRVGPAPSTMPVVGGQAPGLIPVESPSAWSRPAAPRARLMSPQPAGAKTVSSGW